MNLHSYMYIFLDVLYLKRSSIKKNYCCNSTRILKYSILIQEMFDYYLYVKIAVQFFVERKVLIFD